MSAINKWLWDGSMVLVMKEYYVIALVYCSPELFYGEGFWRVEEEHIVGGVVLYITTISTTRLIIAVAALGSWRNAGSN